MNTLDGICLATALADSASLSSALDYAESFSDQFDACVGLSPAEREARMLAVQFPAILRSPEAGDLIAGRVCYGLVGLSPEPCGLGYYCAFEALENWLKSNDDAAEESVRVRYLLGRWQGRTTVARVRAAYPPSLSSVFSSDAWMDTSGVAFPLYRMAGTILDYRKLLALGLDGLEAECIGGSEFHRACASAIGLLRQSVDFYAEMGQWSDAQRTTLRAIRHRAPSTFCEAVQLFWLYALHSGTWNYGRLDMALGPFLDRDLASGRLTEEGALDILCSLWRLMHAYSNQYNNRVIIGGMGRPNEKASDHFALLAIEATRRVRLNQPQLSLRFYEGQNPELWERALDAIGEGCTFPMLYNDDVNIPAVASAFGVGTKLAEQYTPYGCGEYVLSHHSAGTPNAIINLLKALEVALHAGVDPVTGTKIMDGLLPPGEMSSFEQVWTAYTTILERYAHAAAIQQKLVYDVAGREASFLFISMLTSDCLARCKGAYEGGVHHLGGTLETYGNTNTADSLSVIAELVFRRKQISLPDLVAALDSNFEGRDDVRNACLGIKKYGNDEATADEMARRVHRHICRFTREQSKAVGLDSYLVVIINNWANTVLGWKTSASADGRKFGQPMANGNNPTPGSDHAGVTAFLNSLVKLDPSLHAGAVQNMKFGKEWFGSLRPKFDALLRTYFARGGTQAMITVVSLEDLESAMREPEKWGHLMVRVGGFSIRFTELPRDAQLEVLGRTLH